MACEPVALGQNLIHLAGRPAAQAGRWTGAERCQAFRTAGPERPGPPAGIALRLARQVFEGGTDGGEAAAQGPGVDHMIRMRIIIVRCGLRDRAEQRNAGIEGHVDDVDARFADGTSVAAVMAAGQGSGRVEELKRELALFPCGMKRCAAPAPGGAPAA